MTPKQLALRDADLFLSEWGYSVEKGIRVGLMDIFYELRLRVDHGKELREHLRQCNAEKFRLKLKLKGPIDVGTLSATLKQVNYEIRQQALAEISKHFYRLRYPVGAQHLNLARELVLLESDKMNDDQTLGELNLKKGELWGTVFQMGSELGATPINALSTDKLIELLEILEQMVEMPNGRN